VSQVRLYLDEDSMRRSFVFGLRARNIDVLTAAEYNAKRPRHFLA
jgi:hypothetical protein